MKSSITLPNHKIKRIAIGGFDGIHRAHQRLIARLGKFGALVIVDKKSASLTPHIHRCRHLQHPCHFLDFEAIRDLSPDAFVELLKRRFPTLETIIVGYDFHFGRGRSANAHNLETLFDGEVWIVPEQFENGISIHSRTIRDLLRAGKLEQANRLLGRHYAIMGRVVRGQGLGGEELLPTINLQVEDFLIPEEGVYATFTAIDGKSYPSVTFVGRRLTTDGKFAIETHLIDVEIPRLEEGKEIWIYFVKYLRENRKFDALSQLKAQIEKDIQKAKTILLMR